MRVWAMLAVAMLSGCGAATLETGYKPRALGSSDEVRRSYYAAPFTTEANAAQSEQNAKVETRRPGAY